MMDKQLLDDKVIRAFRAANIPGMAIIASRNGDVIYEKYAGYRNVKEQQVVTGETIFGLASLTKSVTALAIMLLRDEGKVNVTDRVVKWLPELKKWNEFYKRHITIHHLLTHTAGFSGMGAFHLARRESVEQDPDGAYLLGEFTGNDYVYTVRDLMAAMSQENAPFIGMPGDIFNYSNESYALLQEIVERASGETFSQFTETRIFKDLGMVDAKYTFDDITEEADVTELYAFTKETPKQVFHSASWWASGAIYSAGALKASARDVQKYLELFRLNGCVDGVQLISAESMREMKTAQVTTPNGVHYGYGLVVGSYGGEDVVGHGGGVKGISSYMLATDNITVTVLTNIAEVAAENLALLVLGACQTDKLTDEEPMMTSHVESLSADTLQGYVGHYATNERQSVDVMVKAGGLQLHLQNNLTSDVQPIGNNQFILPDGKKVSFIADSDGVIQGIFRGMRYIQKRM